MKFSKAAFLTLVFFCGCAAKKTEVISTKTNEAESSRTWELDVKDQINTYTIDLVVIDDCEYLVSGIPNHSGITMTHKGNCKFCLQRDH